MKLIQFVTVNLLPTQKKNNMAGDVGSTNCANYIMLSLIHALHSYDSAIH